MIGPPAGEASDAAVVTAPDEVLADGPRGIRRPAGDDRRADREASFDAFYDREMPRLVALAQALAGAAVADDLAQDAMVTAYFRWQEISRYDHPEAWVRRVCSNAAVSLLRRRAAEARALLRLAARPQPGPLDEQAEGFWDEVRRLPRRQAQAVALRYVYDLDVVEIARTMGCSDGSVKVHLSRARTALAARLTRADGEDRS